MDGSLPTSLKHIISNAEYYGPSLFLLGKYTVAPQETPKEKKEFNVMTFHFLHYCLQN